MVRARAGSLLCCVASAVQILTLPQCFERLERFAEAIRCFERAVGNGDREGVAYQSLAKLYERSEVQDADRAAYYYRKDLDRLERAGEQGQATIEALEFLASHCAARGLFADAERYW